MVTGWLIGWYDPLSDGLVWCVGTLQTTVGSLFMKPTHHTNPSDNGHISQSQPACNFFVIQAKHVTGGIPTHFYKNWILLWRHAIIICHSSQSDRDTTRHYNRGSENSMNQNWTTKLLLNWKRSIPPQNKSKGVNHLSQHSSETPKSWITWF